MDIHEILNWRYAVKKYSNRKVSDADIENIVAAINLSASSAAIQPYRLILVKDDRLRSKLREGSFNPQIEEASHLLVFAAFENITAEIIADYMAHIARVRGLPVNAMEEFGKSLESYLLGRTADENFKWAARQAYIGLGTGLVAAAALKLDTTPMEGFDNEKFDALLGLTKMKLKSVVLLALGYRDAVNDSLATLKKVRLPLEEFVITVDQ